MPPLGPNNRLQAMEMSPFSVTGCKISVSHLLSLSAPEQFQSLLYHQYSAVVFNDLVLSGHHCLRHAAKLPRGTVSCSTDSTSFLSPSSRITHGPHQAALLTTIACPSSTRACLSLSVWKSLLQPSMRKFP